MPVIVPPAEPAGVLVLFANDVKTEALALVERLRAEGILVTTEREMWQSASLGKAVVVVAEEAVEGAKRVVVIPSPKLFESNTSAMIMNMAIFVRKAVPVVLKEVALPLYLSMLSSVNLTLTGERHNRELERLISYLKS